MTDTLTQPQRETGHTHCGDCRERLDRSNAPWQDYEGEMHVCGIVPIGQGPYGPVKTYGNKAICRECHEVRKSKTPAREDMNDIPF